MARNPIKKIPIFHSQMNKFMVGKKYNAPKGHHDSYMYEIMDSEFRGVDGWWYKARNITDTSSKRSFRTIAELQTNYGLDNDELNADSKSIIGKVFRAKNPQGGYPPGSFTEITIYSINPQNVLIIENNHLVGYENFWSELQLLNTLNVDPNFDSEGKLIDIVKTYPKNDLKKTSDGGRKKSKRRRTNKKRKTKGRRRL